MQVGVFDHLDRRDVPLAQFYEDRLALVERYDAIGLYAYHVAEHHHTPLGMSPSPSVFLSAVAQRTRRLRFGPLVYTLPLYHPLRLAEEICMLDHLSGGRLQVGVGRGISPIEAGFYGVDVPRAPSIYREGFELILKALREPVLNHVGEHFRFENVPIEIHPLQRPHPPLWYGVGQLDGVDWCVANAVNAVANGPLDRVREITDRYRAGWRERGAGRPIPWMGMSRHLVIARDSTAAHAIAARAYAVWHRSFMHLWRVHGATAPYAAFPEAYSEARALGLIVAGTADEVRDTLLDHVERSGVNYLLARFAFGDLDRDESMATLDAFADRVLPALLARH